RRLGESYNLMQKNLLALIKPKWNATIATKQGILLESVESRGTQDNKRRDAWNFGNKDGSRTVQKEDSKASVTVDEEGVDWTNHSEDEDYALMAFKHMTRNKAYLAEFQDFNGGPVAFGGSKGYITGKRKIKMV
ncbi:hypothetical protein Tco_0224424, partial [Tanacetum coccineum]